MKLRIIIILAIACLLSMALGAQTTSNTASAQQQANGPADVAGLLYAANFAHWTASPTPSGTRWDNAGQCYAVSGGLIFPMFSTATAITIVDQGVPSNTETVTASLASYFGSGCSVSLNAAHSHLNYYLKSGTAGLQEALNWAGSSRAVVVLTPDWTTLGGTTGMITTARAGANTTILDMRTSTLVAYTCSTTCTAITPPGGTVTSISVVTANGFSGTFSSGATPALTLTYTGSAVSGVGTYTAATSDAFTVTGATASSHCVFSPTNATAAAATAIGFVSGVTTNSVTISHVTGATGGTVNIICTVN